jgi:hypothetical protein
VAKWDNIVFPDPVPVGGWATVTLYPDGNAIFTGHMHDSSGPFGYSDQVVFLFTNSNGSAFSLAHNGSMQGVWFSSGDDDWNDNKVFSALALAFDEPAVWGWSAKAAVNWSTSALLDDLKKAAGVVEGVAMLFG